MLVSTDWVSVQAQLGLWARALDAHGETALTWLNGPVAPVRVTRTWPLARLSTAAAVVAAYLAFVAVGPLIVRVVGKREPYGLKFIYNLAQIALCSYMSIEAMLLAGRNGYGMVCNAAHFTDTPPMANLMWIFYLSKVLDFFDTFFIILGQKSAQLSFLHVYHHATIFLMYWANLNINYDGDVFLTVVLNGLIHAVMYTYYFLTMHTKDVWWKRYLTQLQLVQFTCMMAQAAALLFVCKENPAGNMTAVYFGYIGSLFALFLNFYVRSYGAKTKVA